MKCTTWPFLIGGILLGFLMLWAISAQASSLNEIIFIN